MQSDAATRRRDCGCFERDLGSVGFTIYFEGGGPAQLFFRCIPAAQLNGKAFGGSKMEIQESCSYTPKT
jgi:hypothetical protein